MSNQKDEKGRPYAGEERRRQPYVAGGDEDMPRLLKMALREASDRKIRRKVMKLDLLGGSTWDILLELYISRYNREDISSSSLAFAVEMPLTTAIRHINILERDGIVERTKIKDERVTAIKLTAQGFERMSDYFVEKVIPFS